MILLGQRDMKDPKALEQRKTYVLSLLDEGFPNASPSSQEWVNSEFKAAHRERLRQEVTEIDALLKKLRNKKGRV